MSLKIDFKEWFPLNVGTTTTNDENILSRRTINSVIERLPKKFFLKNSVQDY